MIEFFVPGLAAPKGSPRVVTRGRGGVSLPFPRVLKDSVRTERWESVVAHVANIAMRGQTKLVGQPIACEMTFGFERPTGHYGKKGLRGSAPLAPNVKPDVSKLARSTEDAMTGIVWDDDARIVVELCRKIYVGIGQPTGAMIRVRVATPMEVIEACERYGASTRRETNETTAGNSRDRAPSHTGA